MAGQPNQWHVLPFSYLTIHKNLTKPLQKKTLCSCHEVPLVRFLCRNSTHKDTNPKKRPPPWQSRMPGLAAWLWYQMPPAPGYLIAMGCTTWHTKDFIQRLKTAKEITNLIKASILHYSLPPPNSTAPRMIEYRSPCIPRRLRVLSYPSPVVPTSNLVGCCISWLIGGRLNHDEFRFIIFFAPYFDCQKDAKASPPTVIALRAVSPHYIQ